MSHSVHSPITPWQARQKSSNYSLLALPSHMAATGRRGSIVFLSLQGLIHIPTPYSFLTIDKRRALESPDPLSRLARPRIRRTPIDTTQHFFFSFGRPRRRESSPPKYPKSSPLNCSTFDVKWDSVKPPAFSAPEAPGLMLNMTSSSRTIHWANRQSVTCQLNELPWMPLIWTTPITSS